MIQTILITALSTQLNFVKPALSSTPPTPQVVFTRVLPEQNYVSYVVEKNDTLKSIALAYYGTEDAWTILAKDNPNVSDPENLTEGMLLKIRVENDQKAQDAASQVAQNQSVLVKRLDEPIAGVSASPTDDNMVMPTPTPTITVIPTQTEVTAPSAPVVTQAPIVVSRAASPISDEAITSLGNCEAGMNPTRNSGNGYYGAFQFSYGTWKSMNTGYERADLAPIQVQEAAVKQLLQRSSIYNQFPGCARKMHAEGLI